MAKLYNLARMSTATTGTGALTLGAAVSGFLSFASAGVANGDTITYAIKDGANSEIGRGVYTSSGTTLTRTVLKSTNANAAINLSGSAEVFITASAEDFADKDRRRNRIVNGAMQISQENGDTAAGTTAYYGADQFFTSFVTSAGVVSTQRVQSVTPSGAKDRYRVSVTTADASLAAGEFLTVTTRLEGNMVADFQWGTASAKQIVLRFLWKGPAGTYSVAISNSAGNRSYPVNFTPTAANTDEVITIVIPGDTSGTWLTTTGIGLNLTFTMAAGSTFQGTNATWAAGNFYGTASTSNGLSANTNVFEISEVGLYLDADSTGVTPAYQLPAFDEELFRSQRYFWAFAAAGGQQGVALGLVLTTTTARFFKECLPPMRASPTLAISAAGDFLISNSGGFTATALSIVAVINSSVTLEATSSAMTADRAAILRSVSSSTRLYLSARL